MVSEGAAAFLSERLGTVIGLYATGSLLFLIAPLQAWAERISDAALPDVQDTPEYRSFRKLQIYGEAVSGAIGAGGEITPVDRAVLNRLQKKLGLEQSETAELEREIAEHAP